MPRAKKAHASKAPVAPPRETYLVRHLSADGDEVRSTLLRQGELTNPNDRPFLTLELRGRGVKNHRNMEADGVDLAVGSVGALGELAEQITRLAGLARQHGLLDGIEPAVPIA